MVLRRGTKFADNISGTTGIDQLFGLEGNDTIRGGTGSDTLDGGAGNDRLFGEAGHDTLKGGAGVDTLDGGDGFDKLFGDAGNDTLRGGIGNDQLTGGLGADKIFGGTGIDTVIYSGPRASYTFTKTASGFIVTGPDGTDTLSSDVEKVKFSDGTFVIANSAPTANEDTHIATEDSIAAVTGNVLNNDTETLKQALTVTTPGTVVGIYGNLILSANGAYTYVLGVTPAQQAAVQALDSTDTGVTDIFVYTVSNGANSANGELTINLTGVNDAPVATDASVTTDENSQLLITLPASDVDGESLIYSIVSAPDGAIGTLGSVTGNQVTFTSDASLQSLADGETATTTFTFKANDGDADSDTKTITITINGVNDAPVLSASPTSSEYTSGAAAINIAGGASTLTDAENKVSSMTLTLTATSGALDSGEAISLDAGFVSALQGLGFAVTGNGTAALTISTASPASASQFENIIEQIKYANTDTSFDFNAQDRSIAVAVTDHQSGTANQAITLDLRANVTDGNTAGTFTGANLDDTINGADGNDTITGGGGDDTINGGNDVDTAVYSGARADYSVGDANDPSSGFTTGFSTVADDTANRDGTDTLTGVEKLQFSDVLIDLNQPIQLFSADPTASGTLLASFATIAAAIAAANPGQFILINGTGVDSVAGAPQYTSTTEAVSLAEGVTIKGLGTVSVASIAISGGGAGQNLTIDNINVAGTAASLVSVAHTSAFNAITFKNGDVTGGANHGLFLGDGSGLNATTGVSAITIENATFSGNATTDTGGAGEGAIVFFGYNNNVTLTNVSVSAPGAASENGIQFLGSTPLTPMGTVTLSGVSVVGTYAKTGVAIYNFADINGLTLVGTDPGSALNINVSAAFAAFNIDNIGGSKDFGTVTGLQVTNGHANPLVPDISVQATAGSGSNAFTGDSSNDLLSGLDGTDSIDGGGGDDILLGGTGTDTINGGSGNDLILQYSGDGADTIDGGTHTSADSLVILDNSAASDTLNVAWNGAVITGFDGGTLTGVELRTAAVDHTTAAGGVIQALAADTGSDTLSYAGSAAGVTVNLTTGAASGFTANPGLSSFGITTAISGFENVTGTGSVDNITGNSAANILTGGAGGDTLSGGGGDDIFVEIVGDGADIIDGGVQAIADAIRIFDDAAANDSVAVTWDGTSITSLDGGSITGVERITAAVDNTAALGTQAGGTDTLDYTGSTAGVTVNLAAGTASGFLADAALGAINKAVQGFENVTGTDQNDTLTGDGGANTLIGAGGDDTFNGGGGSDVITGGETFETATIGDTAIFSAALVAADFTATGGGWQVNGGLADGTDTLSEIEIVDGNGAGKFLLVGNGGFATITDALAVATAGDTILLAPGAYNENITIGAGISLLGPNFQTAGTGHTHGAGAVIQGTVTVTAAAGTVTIAGIEFENSSNNATAFNSVVVTSGANVVVNNNLFYSTGPNGNDDRAVFLQSGAAGNVDITNNMFGGAQAATDKFSTANWSRAVWSDGGETSLDITGNTFQSVRTGLNLDGFDNATTSVSGNTFQTSGTAISVGTPTGSAFTGIANNTFKDVDTDFNLQNLTSVANIDLTASNNTAVTFGADTTGLMTVITGTGADTLTGSAGVDVLLGTKPSAPQVFGTDADQFEGKGGNDILYGFGGNDLAVYTGTATVTAITDSDPFTVGNQAGWQVATAGEGTDQLNDIEIVDGLGSGPGGRILLVGNGGFDTLAAAIAAAANGDTIMIAAGTYTGNATIDKSVTILGANVGILGFGGRGAESILTGAITITVDNVVINGIKMQDSLETLVTGIQVDADNVHILNSVIERGGTVNDDGSVGIYSSNVDVSGLLIQGNKVTGWGTGTLAGQGADATITGNLFQGNFTGLQLDQIGTTSITGNNFVFNTSKQVIVYADNAVEDIGAVIANTNTLSGTTDVVVVPGVANGSITGTAFDDVFVAFSGNSTLTGGLGDDVFRFQVGLGGNGTDIITDFVIGSGSVDKLDLVGLFTTFGDVFIASTQADGDGDTVEDDIVINLGTNGTIVLQNRALLGLHEDDVIV